ncbi:MAG: hypothetical protein HQ469_04390 [Cyanobacteria bacterium]|nr:hypothetical protein [Cyanobacteria bacterium bin.275]
MPNPTQTLQQVSWELPQALVECIAAQAAVEGTKPEALAARILSAYLEAEGLTSAGRCSLRTGLRSEGPMPLPIQQN